MFLELYLKTKVDYAENVKYVLLMKKKEYNLFSLNNRSYEVEVNPIIFVGSEFK
jgi:hypothetical protein